MLKNLKEMDKNQIVLILIIALFAAIITFSAPFLFDPFENRILDYHIANTHPSDEHASSMEHEKIILIMATDKSYREIGTWPIRSTVHAKLINDVLSQAKTIAFSTDFLSSEYFYNDISLGVAMEQHGNVILKGTYVNEDKILIWPRQYLAKNAAGIGFSQYLPDKDGTVRRYKTILKDKAGELHNSFSYEILAKSGYDINIDKKTMTMNISKTDNKHESQIQLDNDYNFWIGGINPEHFEVYEYIDVLNGQVPASYFKDTIVIIGDSTSNDPSLVRTSDGKIYDTVVTANGIMSLLTGFSPKDISNVTAILLAVILFLLCTVLSLMLPLKISYIIPISISTSAFVASHYLFTQGIIYIPIANIIFWCIAAYILSLFIGIRNINVIVDHTVLPLNQTFPLRYNSKIQGKERLVFHINNMKGIIESAGLYIQEPLVDGTNDFVKANIDKLPEDKKSDNFVLIKNTKTNKPKYRLLIPHIKTDEKEPDEYTILATDEIKSPYAASSVASLIRNASLYYKALQYGEEKRILSFNMIKCIVAAIDAKDPITAGHSQRVAKISVDIGKKLGLNDRQLEELELAAIIHDVGKIGIQDKVLHKRGVYTFNEFKAMQTHTLKGLIIMEPSGVSDNITSGILSHHERPDGKGYPHGKKEDEIELFPRIIKIADVYDALIGERQYKKAWDINKVCDLLFRGKGTEFDSEIIDIFLDMVKPKNWTPPSATEEKEKLSTEIYDKYISYGTEILDKLHEIIATSPHEQIPLYTDDINLADKNLFMNMEWGEAFSSIDFAIKNPYLFKYDNTEEYYYYGLKIDTNNNDSGFSAKGFVTYIFLRGYLSAGSLLINGTNPRDIILKAFGSSIKSHENYELWDIGKAFILLRNNEKYDHELVYVTKYDFGEKY